MSAEKTEGIVIRQVDFSETSRVVTFFTRDFGKIGAMAKGARRLKSAFESAIDLLTTCRIVFLPKSSGGLQLLTEAQLVSRFQPTGSNLISLYGGYYVAELLDGLTQEFDPHPDLYEAVQHTLSELTTTNDARRTILEFELTILDEIGLLPPLDQCYCGRPITSAKSYAFWVSQGTLLCDQCQKQDIHSQKLTGGTVAVIRKLCSEDVAARDALVISEQQFKEMWHLLTACICQALDRRPKMLRYLPF